MSTRRYCRVLLVVLLALVPALVGVLAASSATSQAAGLRDPQAVEYGGTQAFSITPDPGYLPRRPRRHLHHHPDGRPPRRDRSGYTADGGLRGRPDVHVHAGHRLPRRRRARRRQSQGPSESYTFTNVTANHTIRVTFALDTFTITPTAGPNGSISPSTPQAVDYGGSQTFTITPDTGYHVADVLVDGVSAGRRHELHVHQRDGRAHDQRHVRDRHLHHHAERGLHGSISPSTPQTVDYGGTQAFTIAADPGYHVADVLVDGASVGAVTSYTFTNVTADHTIAATFAHRHVHDHAHGRRSTAPSARRRRRPSTTAPPRPSPSRPPPATTSPTCSSTASPSAR